MPNPESYDHVAVLLLVGLVPLLAAHAYHRLVRQVEAGVPGARTREYRRTIALQWLLAFAVTASWLASGRGLDGLGFAVPGGARLGLGAGAVALGLVFLWGQWRAVSALGEDGLRGVRKQMESVAPMLPRTDAEAVHFRGLSVTAGICEEIVYRGYLVWYLAAYIGPWPAAAAAGVVFGVLHLYQGPSGILRTGAVGLLMAALYVGSGSLLWPMILHAGVDLNGGAIGRRALTAGRAAGAVTT